MPFETIKTVLPEQTTSENVNPFDVSDTNTILSSSSPVSKEPVLIFSKIVTADTGYYYPSPPTIDLVSEDPSRYFIETKDRVFTDNKYLSSITFDIYFLFTNQDVRASDGDSFNVLSSSVVIPAKSNKFINTVSIVGEPVSSTGGVRTIRAQGDPGSTVDLVLKGDDGNFYDWINERWSTNISTKRVRIPTMEDYPGFLPQDILLGFYEEEVFFPRVSTSVKHTVSASPTDGSELKTVKELGIVTSETIEIEDTQTPPVYLIINGITDAVHTFTGKLLLGPFTPNQPCEVEILNEDGEEFVLTLTETDSGAGAYDPDKFLAPTYPTHWSNATEETLSGWELNIETTVLGGEETGAIYSISGTVTKAGSTSLTTSLNVGTSGLGADLVEYA